MAAYDRVGRRLLTATGKVMAKVLVIFLDMKLDQLHGTQRHRQSADVQ